MERKQFTFYASFFSAISRIKKAADRAAAYDAVCDFALYGTEPDLTKLPDAVAIVFDLIKPNLISSRRKSEGGSRKDNDKIHARCEQDMPNKKKKEGEKEKEVEIENECYIPARFEKPSIEQVRAYCLERSNGIDAESFIDFYESKGWKIGKEPMKDWQAAVRTWEKRRAPQQQKHKSWAEIAEQMDEEDRLKAGGENNDA